jgi:DNA invertase Pin-like site-specific DNA recombinase|nr:MAG TPA: integrase [Caudoviricetes sp.]
MNIYYVREKLRNCSIYDIELNVAYYARVSTEKVEQQASIKHQEEHFEELIHSNNRWKFAGSYIDDGISGMHADKREEFQRMLRDAKLGKIDMIITKEISRFARNTLDSIQYTRELLSYGVCVWFQNDGINTIDDDSEFRLTIMAGVAQDEIRKLSSRVKFGHAQSIKNGVVLGHRMYGYSNNQGKLELIPEEADMVRMVFRDYASGMSTPRIEKKLWNMGYRSFKGGKISRDVIKNIIRNPKYKGYYCGGKVKVVDMFTKKQEFLPQSEWIMFKDDGSRVPQIIDETTWEKANAYLRERGEAIKSRRTSFKNENIFTGKLFCANDGAPYWMKQHYIRGKEDVRWVCSYKIKNGAASCDSFGLAESELKEIIAELINKSSENIDSILEEYFEILQSSIKNIPDNKNEISRLEKQIDLLKQKREKILEYNLDGKISDDEFISRNKEYVKQIKQIESHILEIQNTKSPEPVEIQLSAIKEQLEKFKGVTPQDINRQIVNELFEKITVEPLAVTCATLTFQLRSGSLEKWGFPLRRSDDMIFTLHSEQHKIFSRKTCIKTQDMVFFKYKYLLAL